MTPARLSCEGNIEAGVPGEAVPCLRRPGVGQDAPRSIGQVDDAVLAHLHLAQQRLQPQAVQRHRPGQQAVGDPRLIADRYTHQKQAVRRNRAEGHILADHHGTGQALDKVAVLQPCRSVQGR